MSERLLRGGQVTGVISAIDHNKPSITIQFDDPKDLPEAAILNLVARVFVPDAIIRDE